MSCDHSSSFLCSITFEPAYDAVVCTNGHLFDLPAISHWLISHPNCPTCRCYLSPQSLTPVLSIRQFLGPRPTPFVVPPPSLQLDAAAPEFAPFPVIPVPTFLLQIPDAALSAPLPPSDDENDDADDDVPELIPAMVNEIVFDGHGSILQLRHDQFDGLPSMHRRLNTQSNFYNHNSAYPYIAEHVRIANQNFITSNFLNNRVVRFTKYVVRGAPNWSLESIAHRVTRSGLFVYDIFRVSPYRCVIYSFGVRRDGSRHNLQRF